MRGRRERKRRNKNVCKKSETKEEINKSRNRKVEMKGRKCTSESFKGGSEGGKVMGRNEKMKKKFKKEE